MNRFNTIKAHVSDLDKYEFKINDIVVRTDFKANMIKSGAIEKVVHIFNNEITVNWGFGSIGRKSIKYLKSLACKFFKLA